MYLRIREIVSAGIAAEGELSQLGIEIAAAACRAKCTRLRAK